MTAFCIHRSGMARRETENQQMTELETARAAVNNQTFGTAAWEAAMTVVRSLVASENATAPKKSLNIRLVKSGRNYRTA